jgi:hypothetical protein
MAAQPADDRGEEVEVTLVRWPDEEPLRRHLAAARRPRLLLVAPGASPPVVVDDLEDWMRFPLDAVELDARTRVLAGRAHDVPPRPASLVLDGDGVLHHGPRWVALAPTEHRVLAALLAQPGRVVSRTVLRTAGWPHAVPADPQAVDGVVRRLRRRVAPLGVAIQTVSGAGYLLDHGTVDP